MAQLSDDCFAFGGPMMSVDDAVAIITAQVKAVQETEIVDLRHADGRVLATTIVAPLPLPPFNNSAVDGYAVRSADLAGDEERTFPVVGRVPAGASATDAIAPGHAVRIFTGAPMPDGADTVFMQEDVRIDEAGRVVLPAGLKAGANMRPAGEDVSEGYRALPAGQRLRPQDIALAAAFGLTRLEVRRPVRVAVFSTGDEIVSPGAPRNSAQLFDSNRFMLIAMLSRLGCEVSDLGILVDDRASLAKALRAGRRHARSHSHDRRRFDRRRRSCQSKRRECRDACAVAHGDKAGTPRRDGRDRGTPFIGLPGNPVASFVTFAHVVRPTILALAGASPRQLLPMPVRAAFSYKKKIARREYVRVKLTKNADGALEAVKFPREGAGMLSSLVETDGLVELGEDVTRVEPGQTVGFLSYESLI